MSSSAAFEPDSPSSAAPRAALVLVGTPIGNLADASPRMRAEIEGADLIAAEDTRRFLGLAQRLGLAHTKNVVSVFDHNEQTKAADVVAAIRHGKRVVLLTDAGMPAVSDPGYHVVKAVAGAGLPVTSAPGPSAVFTALALSGLPSDRFTFEGFVPRKSGERARLFAELAHERRTMVFFESPHRIAATLDDLAQAFGPERAMTISRELTKTYEEVLRGTIADLAAEAADGLRGELTLVVAGFVGRTSAPEDHVAAVAELVEAGLRAKDAAARIAKDAGLKTREVYEAYLADKA
ncbi:16S rRNA (cytidine(1402)-2'-O)-methyltransferase [Brevibacterium sp. 50QC2O2]|uniref:16S rRNA (cytidine(1402)-2'-O)-methyltransferase n=1 Tax=Brevibacterium TaxID=1696 RepID=UPI00211CFA69|nr:MULTISPECIES: 16S rRNA (cytidine(1402)-2'-O)-methyltransferase [unclassified Brevibacterium]MCQ9384502.1 16S rRNA (cytidine(1402)-2'-O)-methyltransferase [Brevibacterium sp. 68QC2CO]MCQ9387839.1 16S rRNA (cytidine(1402)-2'-O)-methyltransferase [Brevibacterium sp. 50QC2O2]